MSNEILIIGTWTDLNLVREIPIASYWSQATWKYTINSVYSRQSEKVECRTTNNNVNPSGFSAASRVRGREGLSIHTFSYILPARGCTCNET